MKHASMITPSATLSLLSGIALTISGCSVIEAQYGEERYRSLQGKHISEITRAIDLAVYDGQLIIASRGMARGIAILDSGTEVVTHFQSLNLQPRSMVLDSAGRLFMVQEDLNDGDGIGVFDLNTRTYAPLPMPSGFVHRFFASGGHVFAYSALWTTEGTYQRLDPVAPQLPSQGLTGVIPFVGGATSVTVHDDRLFISLEGKRHLQVRELTAPYGTLDSIDLQPDWSSSGWINLFGLTVWKNKLFVLVQLPPDTTYVAVLDAASGAQTGSIPLSLKQGKSAGVRDGILYLYTQGLYADQSANPLLDGGVEAIDLESETALGLVATEAEIGGNLEVFVPFSETAGYALYHNGRTDLEYLSVRKITYSRPVTARKAP